jgi:hypothetical protein
MPYEKQKHYEKQTYYEKLPPHEKQQQKLDGKQMPHEKQPQTRYELPYEHGHEPLILILKDDDDDEFLPLYKVSRKYFFIFISKLI